MIEEDWGTIWISTRSKKRWCRNNDSYWLTGIGGESMYLKSIAIPSERGRHHLSVKVADENGSCELEY